MIDRTVSRFEGGAPALALAAAETCGPPNANQTPTPRGLAGQFQVNTTAPDGSPLWSFLVVRPSASQGTNAPGVEPRHVMHRGTPSGSGAPPPRGRTPPASRSGT